MLLKKLLLEMSVAFRYEAVSQRYYKEFGHSIKVDNLLTDYKVPSYLPYTRLLLEHKDTFTCHFKAMMPKAYLTLTKGSDIEVLDFVGVFLLTMNTETHQMSFVSEFNNDEFLEFYRCAKHIELVLRKLKGSNALNILEAVMALHQCYKIKHCKSLNFINDIYCFVHRTSTVANELVDNPKLKDQFAFFFEQDYNLIVTKTSRVSTIILKKYEHLLVAFYNKRKNYTKCHVNFLPEDFVAQQEEELMKKALGCEIETLKHARDRKKPQKEV